MAVPGSKRGSTAGVVGRDVLSATSSPSFGMACLEREEGGRVTYEAAALGCRKAGLCDLELEPEPVPSPVSGGNEKNDASEAVESLPLGENARRLGVSGGLEASAVPDAAGNVVTGGPAAAGEAEVWAEKGAGFGTSAPAGR